MPRVKDGIERATPEEIDEMARKAKAELKAEQKAELKALKTEGVQKMETNVSQVTEIGLKAEKKAAPDKAIDNKFKFVPCVKKGWVSMSEDEAIKYGEEGILVGFDPANKIGLLKKD